MSPRPPRDGIVALRTLPRRFRAMFTGLGDDESPEALAVRPAPDGTSALGHVVAATRAVVVGAGDLDAILTTADPVVDPVAVVAGAPDGRLEDGLAELAAAVEALADRADGVGADDWARRGTVAGGGPVSAAERFWEVVDLAVEHLHAAGRTLDAVRRAR